MERLLNQYDKEYMKMAMLKHEETFREQVYELHRLYRIQKILMKDITKKARIDPHNNCRSNATAYNRAESRQRERAVKSEIEYDGSDLELTLGPRSYYERKVLKGGIEWENSRSGPSFLSSSSTTGSNRITGRAGVTSKQELLKWGPDPPVSNQDRLNSPPWLFQTLSLNMTS